jgi:hypothetical protein
MENDSEWDLGPDNLYPTSLETATRLCDAVKLRINDKKLTINKKNPDCVPISLFTKFKQIVEQGPSKIALGNIFYSF